jgi:exfoliative toxin A/B
MRMNKVRVFPEPARKTVAIFTAPFSLLTVGYFSSFVSQGVGNPTIVYFLLIGATISYLYVCYMMVTELLKIKFYPTYSGFSFPFVISALAARLGANFLVAQHGCHFLLTIADIIMWIAVTIMVFVTVHYIKYFRFWTRF